MKIKTLTGTGMTLGATALSILLLSSAVWAQDVSIGAPSEPGIDDDGGQTWQDPNPGEGDGGPDIVIDDPIGGDDITVIEDPIVIDEGPTDDPYGDDTGGDAGQDDAVPGDDGSADGDIFIDVMPGDEGVTDLTDPPACLACADFAVTTAMTSPEMASAEVAATVHVAPVTVAPVLSEEVGHAAPAARAKKNNAVSALPMTTDMAECLAAHPRWTWLCGWQNGAGQ